MENEKKKEFIINFRCSAVIEAESGREAMEIFENMDLHLPENVEFTDYLNVVDARTFDEVDV